MGDLKSKVKMQQNHICSFVLGATFICSVTGILFGKDRVQADPELINEWWVEKLELEKAWAISTGKGVTIASCDAGVYLGESDLEPNLLVSKRYDLSDRDHPRQINDGKFVSQGTAAATIMVGVHDGMGTNGIAFDAKLIPLQNFNYDQDIDDLDKELATAACIERATITSKVGVILVVNQTRSGSAESAEITRRAVRKAVESGVVVVSTAGDSGVRLSNDLAYRTGSIVVGSLQRNDRPALFSNYGERITVSTFGEKIYTLGGRYGEMKYFAGSPAAAAQVTATIALMLEIQPKLLPKDIERILKRTRKLNPKNSKVGGQLDVLKALEAARRHKVDKYSYDQAKAARQALSKSLYKFHKNL